MAPRTKVPANPDAWWQQAYMNHPTINATFEYDFGGEMMVPGTKFKVKYNRGEFKFRCYAINEVTGAEWIDAMEIGSAFRSIRIDSIKGIVKPKKARRRRTKKT